MPIVDTDSSDNGSEEDLLNQDFFESSYIWKHEQAMRKHALEILNQRREKELQRQMASNS